MWSVYKLAKRYVFLIVSYVFFFKKIEVQEGGRGSAQKQKSGGKQPK
jgi:hypothetical protein